MIAARFASVTAAQLSTPEISPRIASWILAVRPQMPDVGGSSSSTMVPFAVGSDASCAFDDTPDSVTVNVSSSSTVESCTVGT